MTLRLAMLGAALAIGLSAIPAFAQEPSLRVNIASVTDATYPDAKVVVDVEDDSADGVALGPDNFRVAANGANVLVKSAELASSEDEPLDLTLVMDTSGSMAGEAMAGAKDAAKALVSELAPADRVAVISFADSVVVVQDYTADKTLVTAAIDGLVAQGNTALYQATTVAAFKTVASTATRRAVVLLSDGADFGGASQATRAESIDAARNVGVSYFTIAQGTDLDLPYLQEVSDATRGRLFEAVNPTELRSLYLSIGRILRNQYVVTFDATSVASSPESRIEVRVTDGDREATAQAAYRPAPEFAPVVDISGVSPGDAIDDVRDILVNVGGGVVPTRVVFYVDDVQVSEAATGPFVFTYDPRNFPSGDRVIKVIVELGGEPIETLVPVRSTEPGTVSSSEGRGLPILPLIATAVVVLLVGGGVLMYFRMRHSGTDISRLGVGQRTVPWAQQVVAARRVAPTMPLLREDEPEVEQEVVGEPLGVLISRAGKDLGSEYTVGAAPVSVGSGARCGVRINDPELAAEEARAWVRSGHLMVHKMTRLSVIAADGTSGGWMILEPGDKFEIGDHVFEFRMLDPLAGAAPTTAETEPSSVVNILRDPKTDDPEQGASGPQTGRTFKLADMMPSSELAPSASYDDDDD